MILHKRYLRKLYECFKDLPPFNDLRMPPSRIDWADFLEVEDNTTGQQTLACTASSCEI